MVIKNNNTNMITIRIINPNFITNDNESQTWYSRTKSYDWEMNMPMDDDIKNCTIGHHIDSIELNNFYLNSKKSIDDLIEFLTKSRESLEN